MDVSVSLPFMVTSQVRNDPALKDDAGFAPSNEGMRWTRGGAEVTPSEWAAWVENAPVDGPSINVEMTFAHSLFGVRHELSVRNEYEGIHECVNGCE